MKRVAPYPSYRLTIFATAMLAVSPAFAQSSAPAEEIPSGAAAHEVRGLVVLRISGELLDRTLASDINKQDDVDMMVVGVRARGPSHTEGKSNVQPKPAANQAAFQVTVTGESRADTRGRSGPAIVNSRSVTKWQVDKTIRFENGKFVTRPGTIESQTDLWSTGIGSTLPGLRGRLVKRIGVRKELELRPAATRSVDRQTSEKVLAEVDHTIDQKINDLNERIQSEAVLAKLLPLLDSSMVHMSTNEACIHLAFFGVEASTATICPLNRLEPAETELWINASMLPTALPAPPALPEGAQSWINQNLLGIKLPELALPVPLAADKGALPPMTVQLVDDWIVLRTEGPKEPAVAKSPQPRSATGLMQVSSSP
ncbi:hypothetical protein [Aeoliella sp. SH292]|uniref:hypothetical protein n=1 Tax=Aeoliella sp. SH292 TaxID=3454464 RepID=UPI003F96D339